MCWARFARTRWNLREWSAEWKNQSSGPAKKTCMLGIFEKFGRGFATIVLSVRSWDIRLLTTLYTSNRDMIE